MRIALVQCPSAAGQEVTFIEPLGICYIAAVCRDAGHEVMLRDLAFASREEIEAWFQELDALRPDIVGFSAMSEQFPAGLELARVVKQRFGCKVIFGGWHVSGNPEEVLDPAIDIAVRAEGEDTMLELLEHLETGSPALEEIEGIAFADEGELRVTPPRERIRKLSRLPEPMRDGLPIERYRIRGLGASTSGRTITLSVQASRGCPYKCNFCQTPAIWTNLWARRNPESVVDEVEGLVRRYNIGALFFRDEEFTINKRWVMEISAELARRDLPRQLHWGAFSRVDDIDEELAQAMYEGGCRWLFSGIEATSPEQARRINKLCKREDAERAFSICRDVGIHTHGGWIIGFPWDRMDELEDAFAWIKTLPLESLSLFYAMPYGGTPLREEVESQGLLLTRDYRRYNIREPIIRTPAIPLRKLRRLRLTYSLRFYLRREILARWGRQAIARPEVGFELSRHFADCLVKGLRQARMRHFALQPGLFTGR